MFEEFDYKNKLEHVTPEDCMHGPLLNGIRTFSISMSDWMREEFDIIGGNLLLFSLKVSVNFNDSRPFFNNMITPLNFIKKVIYDTDEPPFIKNISMVHLLKTSYKGKNQDFYVFHVITDMTGKYLLDLKRRLNGATIGKIKICFEHYKDYTVQQYPKPWKNHLYIERIFYLEDAILDLNERYSPEVWGFNVDTENARFISFDMPKNIIKGWEKGYCYPLYEYKI